MKKKNKHERPETYRIVLRCGSWATKTERYYTVYHSSEALEDIYDTFHAGKMDKDADERLVKNGEYRDALNIQVRTTSGEDGIGDAGVVQNIKGNRP